ncbi:E3 ubiquitin-protein ligase RING1-like [Durio zibethinus]|uniref:RING-type E3 ubiquitin transferase n=1 Tax=Durio zibethinus TaxID=66656 RepID=A0A6P6BBL9_DURZI|nr:E3 ubiquitin-protein ligase RING1-like [Durio zibethinus]
MADIPTQSQEPPLVVFVVVHLGSGGVGVGQDNKPGPAPASKASIEAMPRIKVKGSGIDCSICLEAFKEDEEAREMPCKHVFHSGCVEKWLGIHGSCPVCRFLMPSEEAESGGGSGGLGTFEGREIGLGFVQSVLAVASLASLIAMAGSGGEPEQSDAGQVDGDDSSATDMDCN